MCGICGAIDLSGGENAMALVRRMTPTMTHRGPDDEGYFQSGPLALGMRRLSIIDVAGGHQPIFNEDGSVAVLLNGEIYNFRALRDYLWGRGHTFSTHSDSEVVAHAYEEWGENCVNHLQGMFALAIFDRRYASPGNEGTLFLARDRLGIKPLYYYHEGISDCELRIADFSEAEGALDHRAGSQIGNSRSQIRNPHSQIRNSTPHSQIRNSTPHSQIRNSTPHSQIRNSTPQSQIPNFLFASEVRTLLASGCVRRRLSRSALESYLLFGSVSEPETLVEGVFSLPPGHRLTIKLGREVSVSRPQSYWNIAQAAGQNGHQKWNQKQATEQVRSLLSASVRRHLIADVPVGVFLSGGIDSTSLAALASREAAGVLTFTVGFKEDAFNEAEVARKTAAAFGTDHRELMLTSDEMLKRLGEAVEALDQPSIDGVNTYFVSWAASEAGLKVALSGLGGDEVFGGYSTFQRTPHLQRIASIGGMMPDGLRAAMASAVAGATEGLGPGDAARKIAALWNAPESLPDAYYFSRALFTPPQVKALLNGNGNLCEELPWWNWLSQSAAQARKLDAFTAVSCMEAQSYLVSTLLRDTDSMSMAHSLEVRVPFLDHELVEFVTQLPESIKLRKGMPKALLIAALGDSLPAEVVNQPKRGFTFPWSTWLKGPLKKKVEQGLKTFSGSLEPALNVEEVRDVWKNYLQGQTSWSRPWSLFVLNEWTKKNL